MPSSISELTLDELQDRLLDLMGRHDLSDAEVEEIYEIEEQLERKLRSGKAN